MGDDILERGEKSHPVRVAPQTAVSAPFGPQGRDADDLRVLSEGKIPQSVRRRVGELRSRLRKAIEHCSTTEGFEDGEHQSTDASFEELINDALEEIWREDPEVVLALCEESLSQSAAMMEEIVEETRLDLIEFEARRLDIDRKQAETRAILDEVIGRM